MWSVKTGNKIAVLEGNHPNPIGCVAFNPKYMMVASSCNNAVSQEVFHLYKLGFLHVEDLRTKLIDLIS